MSRSIYWRLEIDNVGIEVLFHFFLGLVASLDKRFLDLMTSIQEKLFSEFHEGHVQFNFSPSRIIKMRADNQNLQDRNLSHGLIDFRHFTRD